MQDRFLKLSMWVLVTLSLALTSCGGREGASPTPSLLAAGDTHTAVIKKDDTLWARGANHFGQLGNGTNKSSNTPVRIGADAKWRSVSAGRYFTVAIKKDDTLWAWGLNEDGELGNGTNTNSNTPVQISK